MPVTAKLLAEAETRTGEDPRLPLPGLEHERPELKPQHTTGILPAQDIRRLIREKRIQATHIGRTGQVQPTEIGEGQIQPASLDLRLGTKAYRVRASFLPSVGVPVQEKLEALAMHLVDLTGGAVLEKDCVYIVPLMESLKLVKRVSGRTNPKSSIGRLDVFTRVITDGATEFDWIRPSYRGPLYAEICPRAFSVVVREGSRLCQLRIQRGSPPATDTGIRKVMQQLEEEHAIGSPDLSPPAAGLLQQLEDEHAAPRGERDIAGGLAIHVDLRGDSGTQVVGYKAKKHTGLIDVDKVDHYEPRDFWDAVEPERGRGLILNPGDFYILASKEAIAVPPTQAAEMVAYDTLVGEFRVHYAGFFDPGFGYAQAGGAGSRAVLEVRSHEVPFLIEDGQMVGRLLYERLTGPSEKLYGSTIGSSYQRQGLVLSKQFKRA
jgi:dCTP deaminase